MQIGVKNIHGLAGLLAFTFKCRVLNTRLTERAVLYWALVCFYREQLVPPETEESVEYMCNGSSLCSTLVPREKAGLGEK